MWPPRTRRSFASKSPGGCHGGALTGQSCGSQGAPAPAWVGTDPLLSVNFPNRAPKPRGPQRVTPQQRQGARGTPYTTWPGSGRLCGRQTAAPRRRTTAWPQRLAPRPPATVWALCQPGPRGTSSEQPRVAPVRAQGSACLGPPSLRPRSCGRRGSPCPSVLRPRAKFARGPGAEVPRPDTGTHGGATCPQSQAGLTPRPRSVLPRGLPGTNRARRTSALGLKSRFLPVRGLLWPQRKGSGPPGCPRSAPTSRRTCPLCSSNDLASRRESRLGTSINHVQAWGHWRSGPQGP